MNQDMTSEIINRLSLDKYLELFIDSDHEMNKYTNH